MKKLASIILSLCIILILTACSMPNRDITIQVAFATDELLNQYENFHTFIHVEEAEYMIIMTDTPITNFAFISVGNSFDLADWDIDEDTELYFFAEDVLYSAGELTPETPFMVRTWGDWGMMPRIGITFTDASNVTRYFHIQQSMMDGELHITQF